MLSLSTASFEVWWDIEGGVHPAVAIQHSTIHSSSTLMIYAFYEHPVY